MIVVSAALALAASLGACRGEDPAAVAGEYSRPHEVFVFHGNEPVQVEVEDRLELVAEERAVRFGLEIVGSAGQACRAQGVASARRGAFEHHVAAGEKGSSRECVLRIRADEREIVVEDVDDGCRELYCEGGAVIGRALFARPPG